jgi:hypothetical protein
VTVALLTPALMVFSVLNFLDEYPSMSMMGMVANIFIGGRKRQQQKLV